MRMRCVLHPTCQHSLTTVTNVHIHHRYKQTALGYAAAPPVRIVPNHLEIVHMLLKAGVDTEAACADRGDLDTVLSGQFPVLFASFVATDANRAVYTPSHRCTVFCCNTRRRWKEVIDSFNCYNAPVGCIVRTFLQAIGRHV